MLPDLAESKPPRQELERKDREESASLPVDDVWSERIDTPDLTQNFWEDPEPDCAGLLSADRIRSYHYAVGRMIRPFQEANLNAASYDLTLGPRYVLDGEEATFDAKRRILRIPPGSIAMVTSREVLLMPYWLVATFNLKSKYIFEGLLMGAGPQIDPGYMGVLTCPLHNISNRPIELEFCKPFAKLDFIKTTWGKSVHPTGCESEERLHQEATAGNVVGSGDEPVRLWDRSKNFRPPVSHLAGSEGSRSSLRGLQDEFGDLRQEFEAVEKRSRIGQYVGAGFALGVISALVGLAGFGVLYTNEKVDAVKSERESATELTAEADPGSKTLGK
ncbi:MAG: dCTP deaminase domain-containing protein [Solirubrobacterales bacterium]